VSANVELGVPAGAPAGLRVDLQSSNTAVATVAPFVVFAAGETARNTIQITGVGGGTASISARVGGVDAPMTATVRGGVVSGRVFDAFLNALPGVELTVTGGGSSQRRSPTPTVTSSLKASADRRLKSALDPVSQRRGFVAATMSHPFGSVDVNVVVVSAGRVSGTVFSYDAVTATGAGARVDIFDVRDRSTPSSRPSRPTMARLTSRWCRWAATSCARPIRRATSVRRPSRSRRLAKTELRTSYISAAVKWS
jgi:hypothetical protein